MDIALKSTNKVQQKTKSSSFTGVRRVQIVSPKIVCKYWLAGRCTRKLCKFLHLESNSPQPKQPHPYKRPCVPFNEGDRHCYKTSLTWRNPKNSTSVKSWVSGASKVSFESQTEVLMEEGKIGHRTLCKNWVSDNCVEGDKCKNLHSWFSGTGFSLLAKLEGHSKAVTGITLPSGSQNLLSSSKDKTMRVWNCYTGECANTVDFHCEIGALISEGSCAFLGLQNAVKALNTNSNGEAALTGIFGRVYSIVVGNDMLFAGSEDGTIFTWRFSSEESNFEPFASLKGHKGPVLSLTVGANTLYSGATDSTIKVWDLRSLKCIHTLKGHTNGVTSLLCWDKYLLSGSLDNTIKFWAATENGNLEVAYQHNNGRGVIAFYGIHDAESKPILLCSLKDNTVRLYDLPLFNERGRLFSYGEVESIAIGPNGLFFTGNSIGQLFVWKLDGE